MPTLYIVRGLPGSGKSTYVRNNADNWCEKHFEADMFFTNIITDEYKFDAMLIGEAHDWCYANTVKSLRDGVNVWVSNTFTQLWEMHKYLSIGETIGVPVDIKIIEVKTQYKSVHDIPEKTFEKMKSRWQEIPAEMCEKYTVTRIEK